MTGERRPSALGGLGRSTYECHSRACFSRAARRPALLRPALASDIRSLHVPKVTYSGDVILRSYSEENLLPSPHRCIVIAGEFTHAPSLPHVFLVETFRDVGIGPVHVRGEERNDTEHGSLLGRGRKKNEVSEQGAMAFDGTQYGSRSRIRSRSRSRARHEQGYRTRADGRHGKQTNA
jgi:hypothetical protein